MSNYPYGLARYEREVEQRERLYEAAHEWASDNAPELLDAEGYPLDEVVMTEAYFEANEPDWEAIYEAKMEAMADRYDY
jgi:hypothetical protein